MDSKNAYKVVERATTAVSQKFMSSTANQEPQKTNQDHHTFFQKKDCAGNKKNSFTSDTDEKKVFDDDIACSQ
jgi:hypothetical protein